MPTHPEGSPQCRVSGAGLGAVAVHVVVQKEVLENPEVPQENRPPFGCVLRSHRHDGRVSVPDDNAFQNFACTYDNT